MSEFKGNGGEWYVQEQESELYDHAVLGDYGDSVAIVASNVENIHDARLMAAAPELLGALRWALNWIDSVPSETPLPAMPGFDRDYVDELIQRVTTGASNNESK